MRSMPLFDIPSEKALTVRQPWAHLIAVGIKKIENRTWQTNFRGVLYIHAGSKMHETSMDQINQKFGLDVKPEQLTFSAIIARVDLVDIISRSDDPFFEGPYGWVFENTQILKPFPLSGKMGLFDLSSSTVNQIRSSL